VKLLDAEAPRAGSTVGESPKPPLKADRRRAGRLAKKLLADLGIDHPRDVAMELVAAARGVTVRAAPLSGVQATLVRAGPRGVVIVASSLAAAPRRFVLAHEIGHFELHADVSFLGLCTGDAVPFASASPFEDEASTFASELLLPRRLALPMCAGEDASWDLVRDLADTFRVSLTAAALRFVTLSERATALVFVREGRVAWSRRSFRWKARIERGRAIGAPSTALTARPDWAGARARVRASVWIDDAPDGATIVEDAFAMSVAGGVMVLLEMES